MDNTAPSRTGIEISPTAKNRRAGWILWRIWHRREFLNLTLERDLQNWFLSLKDMRRSSLRVLMIWPARSRTDEQRFLRNCTRPPTPILCDGEPGKLSLQGIRGLEIGGVTLSSPCAVSVLQPGASK